MIYAITWAALVFNLAVAVDKGSWVCGAVVLLLAYGHGVLRHTDGRLEALGVER